MTVTPVVITKDRKGFGMQLKPIRVYIGDSNNYRMHYIIHVSNILYTVCIVYIVLNRVLIEMHGSAWKASWVN